MESKPSEPSRARGPSIILIVGVVVCGGIAVWLLTLPPQPANAPDAQQESQEAEPGRVTADDVERFYVGVAALDVEANQRAGTVFQELSESLSGEPAVWANLAIVRLRLNELPAAREALNHAQSLVSENEELALLESLIEERSGHFDRATELLQQISDPDASTLYRLASLVERTGRDASTQERLELINRILEQHPTNMVAQFQRARLAARLENADELTAALDQLVKGREAWNEQTAQQYDSAREAALAGRFADAARHLAFFENLSRATAPYQDALLALGVTGGSVTTPFREFLKVTAPGVAVAEVDSGLRFELRPSPDHAAEAEQLWAVALFEEEAATLVSVSGNELRVGAAAALPFPAALPGQSRATSALQAVDLNADFRPDLVGIGADGLALYLQDAEGGFSRFAVDETGREPLEAPGSAVWPLDLEADGDMDLLVARGDGTSQLVRNNGDMTFTAVDAFQELPAPRELHWVDLDNDGDVDVVALNMQGQLQVMWNQRAGLFDAPAELETGMPTVAASSFGDIDLDGAIDVIALDQEGTMHVARFDAGSRAWLAAPLVQWEDSPDLENAFADRRTALWSADIDNNGAIDLVASAGEQSAIWLGHADGKYARLEDAPPLFVTSVIDVDGDGLLDVAGNRAASGRVAGGRGTKNYHWQVLKPRANSNAADQRINSFGLGGRVELRAGRLLQVAPINSPRVHFGLGTHERAGVARIVWPNGTVQAEFELSADQVLTAEQRLKGSCPFVFTRNDEGLHFVKDFIWRSPLGLKINSQDTAGVTQTEDWIKIPGRFLAPQDGSYEVRITAELWETHFFDLISLLVVDHPSTVEVFVDERFHPTQNPDLRVTAVTGPRALARITDESGRDVAGKLHAIDGATVDGFELGDFQGLAREHWVEFQLDDELPTNHGVFLVGHGWVYPTDSSLNVAMSQGDFPKPHGLILEVPEANGTWRAVSDDLGFPAGKNKTVLIPLPVDLLQAGQRRFRLRTNLEVYWDYLGWAATPTEETELRLTRMPAGTAELRYRGFSELSELDRRRPDIPNYDRLSGTGQRWRDLEGYHTRFGDVRELLETVDDRYVIMNAGDEFVLRFPALPAPDEGWTRDFVLIGDGWVKDGDYNTTHSRTVHPLPSHADADYSRTAGSLFDDPVYQQHRHDWQTFHTRYVTPDHFARGLWPARRGPVERKK